MDNILKGKIIPLILNTAEHSSQETIADSTGLRSDLSNDTKIVLWYAAIIIEEQFVF